MDSSVRQPRTTRFPVRLLSDRSLGVRVAAGDERAFEETFRRHNTELYRYCRSIVGNEHDAMDALQNTMAAALRKLPGEKREIRLKPWLFRVAHNECIDIIKSSKLTAEDSEIEVESSVRIESEVANRELLRQLLADIDRLPSSQRGALIMRELNGLEYSEIGEALEISAAAARQTVYEARLSLRELNRGRTMRCEDALKAISAGDGRMLRGRRLRAHLRSCKECDEFRSAIESRQEALRSLVPVLPAATAASLLGAIGGGSGGGGFGGGLLTVFGGGSAIGAGSKVVTVVAVTAGLGAGTVGVMNRIDTSGTSNSGPTGPSRLKAAAVPGDNGLAPAALFPSSGAIAKAQGSGSTVPARDGEKKHSPSARGVGGRNQTDHSGPGPGPSPEVGPTGPGPGAAAVAGPGSRRKSGDAPRRSAPTSSDTPGSGKGKALGVGGKAGDPVGPVRTPVASAAKPPDLPQISAKPAREGNPRATERGSGSGPSPTSKGTGAKANGSGTGNSGN